MILLGLLEKETSETNFREPCGLLTPYPRLLGDGAQGMTTPWVVPAFCHGLNDSGKVTHSSPGHRGFLYTRAFPTFLTEDPCLGCCNGGRFTQFWYWAKAAGTGVCEGLGWAVWGPGKGTLFYFGSIVCFDMGQVRQRFGLSFGSVVRAHSCLCAHGSILAELGEF